MIHFPQGCRAVGGQSINQSIKCNVDGRRPLSVETINDIECGTIMTFNVRTLTVSTDQYSYISDPRGEEAWPDQNHATSHNRRSARLARMCLRNTVQCTAVTDFSRYKRYHHHQGCVQGQDQEQVLQRCQVCGCH